MAQSNLAENTPISPESSQVTSQKPSEAVNGRTSAQQAEIERIGKADTYCKLDRDDELFTWLNDQRDLKLCGYIVSDSRNGLPKACEYYRMAHVKRRGSLFQIPATVFYAEVKQRGKGTDLYNAILEEFGHPLSNVGSLASLRSRTWDNLKRYGVKILIIGNADYLNLEAFNELLDLYDNLRISVILAGTNQLEATLAKNSPAYINISNYFLEWHEFPSLTTEDVAKVVEDWEETYLTQKKRLNLTKYPEVIDTITEKSGGLIESVYDILRQIAMFKIEDKNFELTPSNLLAYLSHRKPPTQRRG